jgi:hypothetical protein
VRRRRSPKARFILSKRVNQRREPPAAVTRKQGCKCFSFHSQAFSRCGNESKMYSRIFAELKTDMVATVAEQPTNEPSTPDTALITVLCIGQIILGACETQASPKAGNKPISNHANIDSPPGIPGKYSLLHNNAIDHSHPTEQHEEERGQIPHLQVEPDSCDHVRQI